MPKLPKKEKSLWRDDYVDGLYPELSGTISVDVIIIGAGITGLTAGYLLKQKGLKVAVLDKSSVAGGTSGRTTGKVTAQHGLIYNSLLQRFGAPTAQVYADATQAALQKISGIIVKEKIDCDWQRDDNYVYTADPGQVPEFKKEAKAAVELGLPASFEHTTPLPFFTAGAVKFTNQAKFNAQKYLAGLAAAVNGGGSYVFEHSNVTHIKAGKPCRVRTSKGSVTGTDIIVATNVPTLPLVARGTYCLVEYPQESYIVAGKLPKKLPGMYISPDKEHYSILPVNVNGKRMILIGGESHISGWRRNKKARYKRLAKYAEKHFGVTAITHRWSDRDYMAYDDLPVIGKLYPWSHHMYVGTAYRKWGLTNGTVAGMILADLVRGKKNPWADTFHPHRLRAFASIPRVIARHMSGNS